MGLQLWEEHPGEMGQQLQREHPEEMGHIFCKSIQVGRKSPKRLLMRNNHFWDCVWKCSDILQELKSEKYNILLISRFSSIQVMEHISPMYWYTGLLPLHSVEPPGGEFSHLVGI